MENLLGRWARCSYGMVASRLSLPQVHLCFASSRCNNVLYIISVLILYFRPYILTYFIAQRGPSGMKCIRSFQKVSDPSRSIFHVGGEGYA